MATLFLEILKKDTEAIGIKLDSSALSIFHSYYHELKRWSRAYNLTALRDEKDITERLFIDSLGYHVVCRKHAASHILDIGSGAGFPGLVLAVLRPESMVTLIEPSKKKTAFLRAVIKKVALNNTEVVDTTVEEFISGCDKRFDMITTRALFSAKELLKKSLPLQSEKAVLLLSKGRDFQKEIDQLKGLPKKMLSSFSIEHKQFHIPNSEIIRNFIIIKRT